MTTFEQAKRLYDAGFIQDTDCFCIEERDLIEMLIVNTGNCIVIRKDDGVYKIKNSMMYDIGVADNFTEVLVQACETILKQKRNEINIVEETSKNCEEEAVRNMDSVFLSNVSKIEGESELCKMSVASIETWK